MKELSYRKAVEGDIEYLLWLRKETIETHLINSGVLLSEEDQVLRINYLFDQARIIIRDKQKIGLLKLDEREDEVELVQVQLDPKFQRKGIGQQVIKSVIENALNQKKKVSLSVLKQNPAKVLYQRMGFKIIGEDDSSFIMQYVN
jgi:ribosomal protein S18 acetylase RimI-like enzyme